MYFVPLLMVLVASAQALDPITDQLLIFKNETQCKIEIMTTSSGMPVEEHDAGSTLNTNLYSNAYFMDKLNHFIRENIPERIVHAKGTGAHGYFKVTHNFAHICKAELFSEIGKITPILIRLSIGVNKLGESDTIKTPMGFACKFYTKEGNLDLLGLNTPLFAIKDPMLFPNLIHILKRNPVTNSKDSNMMWDFITLNPSSIPMFLMLLGERGIPLSYRHMPAYFVHTFQVQNSEGAIHFCRFRLNPTAGVKFMNSTQGASTACSNPDYYSTDLYRSIANGDIPCWEFGAQILTPDDVKKAKVNVFDTTTDLPEDKYKFHPIGQMCLDRNPVSQFLEVEQAAFNPANLVPGILGAPDKAFEARLMFYRAAQDYRVGTNHNNLPINCPFRSKVFTYNRDGFGALPQNGIEGPNYEPNSFGGAKPYCDKTKVPLWRVSQTDSDNFEQSRKYYLTMTPEDKTSFVQTAVGSLCLAANFIQDRAVEVFGKIDCTLQDQIAKSLAQNNCKK